MVCEMIKVREGETYPGDGWFSINIHWWDSIVVIGAVSGDPGGHIDVWATGNDFADAVANAIRYVEAKGHRVSGFTVNM